MTTTLLNFVLAFLLVLCVLFAYLTIKRTGAVRAGAPVVMQVNNKMAIYQGLVTDVSRYNQSSPNPEVTRMLQNLQGQLAKLKQP